MRSKAPLALMEQMVMLLVFALAAALCLQAFALSDRLSRREEARDRAVVLCQSAAETIRSCGGDMSEALSAAAEKLGGSYEQGILWLDYDENWEPIDDGLDHPTAAYRLEAGGAPTQVPGLGMARVWVRDGDDEEGDCLFALDVAWQTPLEGDSGEVTGLG